MSSDTPQDGPSRPLADKAPRRPPWSRIPTLYYILVLVLMGGDILLAMRDQVVTECAKVLLVEDVKDVDTLVTRLTHLKPKVTTPEKSDEEGFQEMRLIFPWPSALFLWVKFDPDSKQVAEHNLIYFASEKVNLVTHEGANGPSPATLVTTFLFALAGLVFVPLWHKAVGTKPLIGAILRFPLILSLALLSFLDFLAVTHFLFLPGPWSWLTA